MRDPYANAAATAKASAAQAPAAPWVMSERVRDVLLNLVVAGLYWVIAELTLLPSTPAGSVTPMWPAAGLAVTALLLGGTRLLPGIALGSFLTTGFGVPIWAALLVAGGSALEAIVDVTLLRRFAFDPKLERTRDVVLLGLVVAPVGAFVTAIVGATATLMAGAYPASDYLHSLVLWWLRNWLGVQIVVTLGLTWATVAPDHLDLAAHRRSGRRRRLPADRQSGALRIVGRVPRPERADGVSVFSDRRLRGAALRADRRGDARRARERRSALPIAALGLGPFTAFPLGFTQILLLTFLMLRVAQRPDAGRGDGRTRGRAAAADRARGAVAALAEDGGRRPAGGRHRARLQQPADGDHRLHRRS